MSATRSDLHATSGLSDGLLLLGTCAIAAVLHGAAVLVVALLPLLPIWSVAPPADDLDAIEVSLVSLPRSSSKMAQMDVQAPAPPAPVNPEAPPPELAPGTADDGPAEPTPDTVSDLAFKTPDAPPDAKGDPNREQRDAAKRDLLRQLALQNLDAPMGTASSQASDPNATSDERIDLGGTGVADPELAAYVNKVQQLVKARFSPPPTVARSNPKIKANVVVYFDMATGQVQSQSFALRSGNASWDGAAERAVEGVGTLPPPPEKYRDRIAGKLIIRFNAEDYL